MKWSEFNNRRRGDWCQRESSQRPPTWWLRRARQTQLSNRRGSVSQIWWAGKDMRLFLGSLWWEFGRWAKFLWMTLGGRCRGSSWAMTSLQWIWPSGKMMSRLLLLSSQGWLFHWTSSPWMALSRREQISLWTSLTEAASGYHWQSWGL